MLDWVCEKTANLVLDQGINPGEIAILSPFLSDSLRVSISTRVESLGIPWRSHRPSRALRDEPITQCLITLAILGHPNWINLSQSLQLNSFDFAYAFMQILADLDLVRAQILSNGVFKFKSGIPYLDPFISLKSTDQERITYQFGEKYEIIREWLLNYQNNPPLSLDHFFSRLFGEVLSQEGFGFHTNYQAGEITANLIESIQKFRWIADSGLSELTRPLGLEYLDMIETGVIAAQYLRSWEAWPEDAVMVIPAHTFLALALENLGFGRDIALVVLAILLGGGVFATALAFGLAGKELARESLERMTREAREEDRDTLSHL